MAFRSLYSLFRRLDINSKSPIVPRYYTGCQCQRNITADHVYKPRDVSAPETSLRPTIVTFSPRSINLDLNLPSTNAAIRNIIEFPILPNLQIIEPPSKANIEKVENVLEKSLELPSAGKVVEKQAARMITVRKHKMRKHKLKKLRKKMKFVWAKVRQKRELRKEKAFRAMLVAQMHEADKFDAKEYVAEKIRKATEVHETTFHGRDIPDHVMKEMLQKKKEREQKMAEKRARDARRKEIKF